MKRLMFILLLGMFMVSFSSAIVWDNNAYYKLDGTSGPVIDSTLNLNNGVATGGVTRGVTGILNDAFSLSGTNQYVNATSALLATSDDFSVQMWVNWDGDTSNSKILLAQSISGTGRLKLQILTNSSISLFMGDDGTILVSNTTISSGGWTQIVLTKDNTTNTMNLFMNGVLVDEATSTRVIDDAFTLFGIDDLLSGDLDADIDEIGSWSRAITPTEVTELYNSGAALAFVGGIIVVDLVTPVNQSVVTGEVQFSTQVTPGAFNATNATNYVWFSNGTLFNTSTNALSGNTQIITQFNVTEFAQGDFIWNTLGCSGDGVGNNCTFASLNLTFQWAPFQEDSVAYENFVLETSNQDFELTVTIDPTVLSLDAIFNYNGSLFTSDVNCVGAVCTITSNIDIPLVSTGESQNKSFSWQVTVFDGTNSFSVNTELQEQNVTRIHLEECTTGFTTVALNFTAFDESTLAAVDPFEFQGDFDMWLGTGSVRRDSSFSNASVSSIGFCITPTDENFMLDGIVEYDEASGTNYTRRNYFFQNDTINSTTQNISLGLLLADQSTTFILKVQDTDILPVANVLIFTERFYPGTNTFEVVQVGKTDDSGQTVGFFKTETVDYRFILKINGTTVLTTGIQKIVGTSVPFTLTFTIGEDEGSAWEDFEEIDDLDFINDYNKTPNIYFFTYTDTSGEFTSAALEVYQINATGDDLLVCNVTSIQSSASLECNMTGNATGQYIAKGIIFRNGVRNLVFQESFNIEDFSVIAGELGLFLGWFIILIASFAFRFNEIAGIFMVNIAMIFVNGIGLIAFGPVFIGAMIAISILIGVILER